MNAITGDWGNVFDTTIIGIHQVVMEDGRVLYWGGDGNGNAFSNTQKYGIFDPVTGEHEILEAAHVVRMFCGAGVVIPGTDKILISGGNGNGSNGGQIFDLSDFELTKDSINELSDGRFYPTTVTLSSGQVVILGGNGPGRATPEIFTLGEGWRTLDGATNEDLGDGWWYPRTWVNPDGKIIVIPVNGGSQNGQTADDVKIWELDVSGNGSITEIGTVPFTMDVASTSAVYEVGKAVVMDASGDLWYMDFSGAVPQFTFAADMPTDRNNADMTVLPDGRILINGGTTTGNSQDPDNAILQSTIFDPFQGTVTEVDSEDVMRLYHSSSTLLADGTILSMGGGGLNNTLDFMDAQIYQPDYLFNDDGTLADRPEITAAPDSLEPGETFTISVDDASAIARITLVKTGAVTHSINMDPGRMDLAFTVLNNNEIQITVPDNPYVVGAGNWMLFAINGDGVPSEAPIISIEPTLPLYTDNSDPELLAEYFAIPSSTTTLDSIDFDSTPIETELVSSINESGTGSFFPGGPTDDFAARYTGDFVADQSGSYTFHLTSDDGAVLIIDGQVVIDNDGLHASREESATINLSEGSHSIEVLYFERGGTSVVDLDWAGPGFGRTQMTFEGGSGAIVGTAGNDELFGTDGSDTVIGNGGSDKFNLSAGNDTIVGNENSYDQIDTFGSSSDFTFVRNADGTVTASSGLTGTDTLTSVEGVWFGGEEAWYSIDSLINANPGGGDIVGTSGNDDLSGTRGDDVIIGNGGSDKFNLSAGNDSITGNEGSYDQIDTDGSASDYTFTRNADGTVTVTSATTGTDTLDSIEGVWFRGEEAWYSIDSLIG